MRSMPAHYLLPTEFVDSDHEAVVRHAAAMVEKAGVDPAGRAVSLYYAVRDGIRYDSYTPCFLPEHFRASDVLERGKGYCVCKAALLCALARAAGIPSRLCFADVRNHLAGPRLLELLRSDVFVYHGITEFYLNGTWVKATPAFDAGFYKDHGVPPLEFDGRGDSLLQAFTPDGARHLEYVADHGVYADVPYAAIMAAFKQAYGADFIARWRVNNDGDK